MTDAAGLCTEKLAYGSFRPRKRPLLLLNETSSVSLSLFSGQLVDSSGWAWTNHEDKLYLWAVAETFQHHNDRLYNRLTFFWRRQPSRSRTAASLSL